MNAGVTGYGEPSEVPFTVMLDMDGVLFNFGEAARAQLIRHFSEPRDVERLARLQSRSTSWRMYDRDWGIEFREFDELMQKYAWSIFGSLNPDHVWPGALEGYRSLVARGYRLELLTNPWYSAYEDSVEGKWRWIDARLNPVPHSVHFIRPGEAKAEWPFDVAVEDNIKNACHIALSGRFVIVPHRPWNDPIGPDGKDWDILPADLFERFVLWADDWHEIVDLVDACYGRKAVLTDEGIFFG